MSSVRLMKSLLEAVAKNGGFDRHLSRVKILAGGNGSLTAVMQVEKEDANRGGFLHGAMSALLVDGLSSTALLTHPECKSPGVSVDIHMTYIKAAPIGQEILIKAATEKLGRRLAFLTVDIYNKATGEVIVKGTHTKFIGT